MQNCKDSLIIKNIKTNPSLRRVVDDDDDDDDDDDSLWFDSILYSRGKFLLAGWSSMNWTHTQLQKEQQLSQIIKSILRITHSHTTMNSKNAIEQN